ncbi:hypothetical protein PENTCL1PPCAC_24130, partial [Pristionchus entomophagus]
SIQEYVSLLVEMETRLLQARIGAARARTLVGHSYASLTAVDDVEEMRAVVRVEVSSSNEFTLVREEEEGEEKTKEEKGLRKRKGGEEKGDDNKEEKEDDEEEEKPKRKVRPAAPPSFRPYGILEPGCAKETRKEAAKAAELAIAAATVRAKIIDCERQTKQLLANVEKPELETIFKMLVV